MTDYPSSVPYLVNGETVYNETNFNPLLRERDKRTEYLKQQVDLVDTNFERVRIRDVPIYDTVTDSRIVYFDGAKWNALDGLVPVGEIPTKLPMGMAKNITGITNNKKADIYEIGKIYTVDSSIVADGSGVQIGVPYFLSPAQAGKITSEQPQSAIYIGVFLTSSTFLLNIQYMTTSHIHRRMRLDPTKWVDSSPDYLLYPTDELGQLPLPFMGTVMVLESTYMPKYGPYIVDIDGLKILDQTFFENLISVAAGQVYPTISQSAYDIEVFWSDPRTLTTPGVMQLTSTTDNLVIENQVPGQPANTGSLLIKNIPILEEKAEDKAGSSVIKDIQVGTGGEIYIYRGEVVEKVLEGSNVSTDREQGSVTVSSGIGRFVEEGFTDVFLKGALSRVFPNTVMTYTEFPYQRTTSAIYKFAFPDNFDKTQAVSVYLSYFGAITEDNEISFNLRRTIISVGEFVSEAAIFSTQTLQVAEANKLVRELVLQIDTGEFKSNNNTLFLQIERETDTNYQAAVGVSSATVKYRII